MRVRLALIPLMFGTVAAPAVAQAPEYETTPIAEGVFQYRWRGHNGLIVVGPSGVVAVDPISTDAAAKMAEEVRRVAPDRPLSAVVYSHDHADHATGADVLRNALGAPGAPIVAHANAKPKIQALAEASLPVPDSVFTDRLVLDIGRPVELIYLGPSHSDNMIVTYLPDARVAFAVDFVSNDRVGYRDLPDYHFPEFFTALDRLLEIPFQTIVFGHGPPGDRASIERQIRYYSDLRAAVADAKRRGLSEDEAAAQVRLPAYESWGGYADWFALNVRGMYRGLTISEHLEH
jgi:glyoxylase-like metal-dependent hydrolase (beta-lactamase superfamily II)